jgi:hypothetical protein
VLTADSVVWLLVVLEPHSDAGAGLVALFTLLYGGAILAVWVVRLVLFVRTRRSRPRPLSKWFIVPPAAIVLSLVVALLLAPRNPLFRIRFALSEEAFTREARALLASGKRQELVARSIGLFRVERLTVSEGQARFITTSCGVVDSCGVVYSPDGEPARWMEDRFTPLSDGWWHVYEGF